MTLEKTGYQRIWMRGPFKVFKELQLDAWYKLVGALGIVLILLSITVPLQVASNSLFLIFGIGLLLYNLGRWKNVKTTTSLTATHKVTHTGRKPDIWGLLMEGVGLLIIFYGIWLVIKEQTGIQLPI